MKTLALQMRLIAWAAVLSSALAFLIGTAAHAQQPGSCSVWLIESSRFMKVPFGSFMPDRAFVPGSNKPDNNINDGRSAGQRRRDQVRQRADPVRYRLEAAGLPQDDRLEHWAPIGSSSRYWASMPPT